MAAIPDEGEWEGEISREPTLPTEYRVAGLVLRTTEPRAGRRPLWSLLWPAGAVLAELVAGELAAALRGRRVAELGCGLGAAGIAAARAGAQVTLTDGDPDALAAAAENATANGATLATLPLVWSRVPDLLVGAFACVLAADVTYTPTDLAPLAGAFATLLAPDGEGWLADPGRAQPAELLAAFAAAGLPGELWRTADPPAIPTTDGSSLRRVHVYRFSRR